MSTCIRTAIAATLPEPAACAAQHLIDAKKQLVHGEFLAMVEQGGKEKPCSLGALSGAGAGRLCGLASLSA
jgi:hypothetical protein